jgi:hypothetical protein
VLPLRAIARAVSHAVATKLLSFHTCRVFLPPHPRAGFSEVLIDGLPGTPDGISRSRNGNAFWVSLVSNIPPSSKWFGPALERALLARIPENRRPVVGGSMQQLQLVAVCLVPPNPGWERGWTVTADEQR